MDRLLCGCGTRTTTTRHRIATIILLLLELFFAGLTRREYGVPRPDDHPVTDVYGRGGRTVPIHGIYNDSIRGTEF